MNGSPQIGFRQAPFLDGENLIFVGMWEYDGEFLPIDPDFKSKRTVAGEHNGHKVWGPLEPPIKQGIHGTNVAVDWDICTGDGICIENCPVSLYDWGEALGHPVSEKKSDPAREGDCIQCLACEMSCPNQAIKITPP